MFLKISGLKKFANFSGKHLRWGTAALQALRPVICNFVKKRLQHKCFFAKLLRKRFSTEQLRWLDLRSATVTISSKMFQRHLLPTTNL